MILKLFAVRAVFAANERERVDPESEKLFSTGVLAESVSYEPSAPYLSADKIPLTFTITWGLDAGAANMSNGIG